MMLVPLCRSHHKSRVSSILTNAKCQFKCDSWMGVLQRASCDGYACDCHGYFHRISIDEPNTLNKIWYSEQYLKILAGWCVAACIFAHTKSHTYRMVRQHSLPPCAPFNYSRNCVWMSHFLQVLIVLVYILIAARAKDYVAISNRKQREWMRPHLRLSHGGFYTPWLLH